MVTMFILLGGAPGVPGAGGASIPRTVPSATSLLGVDLNSQGLFLDSGAVGGVSMSSGLQIWIG
jgi:hypothetical protein